jgi:hypothetical protein
MRKITALAVLIAVIFQACRKENSATTKPENRTQASIEIDGETVAASYNGNDVNNCEVYSFIGSAGYYYGVSPVFDMSSNEELRITFGTLLTDSSSLTEQDFLKLVKKGDRTFGSLGAFNSYPALDSNKVEVAFTDKNGQKWCSTEIIEQRVGNDIEATVKVHQPEGKFEVKEVEKVSMESGTGFRLKGNFKCFIYEVNGKRSKKMKGEFTGIVKMN